MTGAWLPFRYRDFYDLPRMLVVEYGDRLYLFDAPFDDETDEYASEYTVYRLPEAAGSHVERGSWMDLAATGEKLGQVSVSDVAFDESKRRLVGDSVFQHLGIDP